MNSTRSESLPRSEILRGKQSIKTVLAAPPVSSGTLRAHFVAGPCHRVAFFVTKEIGKAVVRNRCKRHMRETYRRMKRKFPEGGIIFRLKTDAGGDELCESFSLCAQKLRGMGA